MKNTNMYTIKLPPPLKKKITPPPNKKYPNKTAWQDKVILFGLIMKLPIFLLMTSKLDKLLISAK